MWKADQGHDDKDAAREGSSRSNYRRCVGHPRRHLFLLCAFPPLVPRVEIDHGAYRKSGFRELEPRRRVVLTAPAFVAGQASYSIFRSRPVNPAQQLV
jgi:hypothetical protein